MKMFTLFQQKLTFRKGLKTVPWMDNEYYSTWLDNKHLFVSTRHKSWCILTDKEYKILRSGDMEQDPFLFNCLESLGIIITEDNIDFITQQFRKRYSFLFRPVTSKILVFTNNCNLACVYCHARTNENSKEIMSEANIVKSLDFLLSIPLIDDEIRIEFQGGEPLLQYKKIQFAMDYVNAYAKKRNLRTSYVIVSNLAKMNSEIAADIAQRGNIALCTSVDGPKELHDSNRPTLSEKKSSYDLLQNGLAELEKYSIKAGNLTTFTTKSFAYKEEIIESAIEKGSFYFRPLSKIGRGLGLNELDVDTAFEFWKYLLEKFINYSIQTNRIVKENRASDMLKNLLHLENDYMCQRKPCGAGISMLSVNWNGDIVVCDMGRSQGQMLVVGNVAKDKYNDIILSDDIVGLRTITNESTPGCATCAYGSYCGTCMANDSALMGNPIPRITTSFDCQINLKMFNYLLLCLMDTTKRRILIQWTK